MGKLTQEDLLAYEKAKAKLAKAKNDEIVLRNKIINSFKYDKVEGVQHKSIADSDIDIVVTLALSRKPDKEALDAIWVDLDKDQRDAIKYTPEVKTKEFKALVKNGKAGKLLEAVIEKPSQASVTLKFD